MERDDDQPAKEFRESLNPDQEIKDQLPSDDNSTDSEAAITHDLPAPSDETNSHVSSSSAAEASPGEEGSVLRPPSESSEDVAASDSNPMMPAASNLMWIEPPAESATPPTATSPSPRDLHDLPLPLKRAEALENEPTPAEQTVPDARMVPGGSGVSTHPPEASAAEGARPVDLGQPMPRVQVLVMLAEPYAALEDIVAHAAEKMAPKFQQLAGMEIQHAEWIRKCEARAADYRLRGPF